MRREILSVTGGTEGEPPKVRESFGSGAHPPTSVRKKGTVRRSSSTSVSGPRLLANHVMRTKSLLLAALRVWELKQRIPD